MTKIYQAQRFVYHRAIDGVADGGLVPLRDDVEPDWTIKYVPKKVKKGFDCDGYYYWNLPRHIREGRAHPIELTDPKHATRLQKCARYAIATYNAKKKGAKLTLEAIEKVNVVLFNGLNHLNYFMTLKVKDESTIPAESKLSRAIVGYLGSPGKPLRLLTTVSDLENNDIAAGGASKGWIGGSSTLENL
ncbi:hypothetical protein Tsubulata_023893 [Turnera subulata]|uniref:Cystatin domain-containing protein n=1 Tax=Turnera subulata TaxID=218843 RepID=A0A9Q0JFG9_9ROSI|nr:hypothetical protein Tsubulata_023893 [Turnera subulata]